MNRAVVVCHPPQGVSPTVQGMIDTGVFDCEDCTVQVHIHVLIPFLGLTDIQGRHERTCPTLPPEVAAKIAGAEGLN